MPLVSPTLPNDGESADAVDVSGPFLALLAVFNGHIGADNLEPGTIVAAIGNGEITTAKLNAEAVTKDKLAPNAVSPDKMALSGTTASNSTITPVLSSENYTVTALTANATIAVPTGTPQDGQVLSLRFKDNGTARTLTWNAIYRAIGVTLPTATVANKTYYVGLKYNSADTKWDALGVAREA